MNLQQRSKLLVVVLILVLVSFAAFGARSLQGQPKPAKAAVANDDTLVFLPIASNQWVYKPPTCYRLSLTHTSQGTDPVASPVKSPNCDENHTYRHGDIVELSGAAPDSGWHIDGWMGTVNDASKEAFNKVAMPSADHTASVIYYKTTTCHSLTLTHTGQGTDPVASPEQSAGCPAGKYQTGEKIQLSGATPDAGWHVAGWTGTSDDASTGATNSVTMPTTDHTAGVNYARTCYRLTLTHSGQGSDPVASPDMSDACAEKDYYVGGEKIKLSAAVPDAGWKIAGWIGTGDDTSSAATNNLSMPEGDHIASVIYDKVDCYHLTLSHTGSGSDPKASPLKSASCTQDLSYTEAETINLSSAVPDAGWFIDSWTGTGDDTSTNSSNSVTMPGMDHSAAVNYKGNCYTLTLGHTGQGNDPTAAPSNSAGCSNGKYSAGEPLSFSGATPDKGWHITGWTGTDDDSSTSATNSAAMPANNHSVSVVYDKVCFMLTLGHTGQGSDPVATPTNSTGCSAGYYMLDEIISLSGANPTTNWYVESWTGTDNNNSTANTNTVTMPANAHSAEVNYNIDCWKLTVAHTGMGSDPVASPNMSTGCNSGYYVPGASINLSGATPDPGWNIISWSGTNNNGSTADTNTVTMPNSAHTAGVNFVENVFPFACVSGTGNSANYGFSGTVSGFTPAAGDVLAAFTSDGIICTGNEPWDGSTTAVTVWGDNDETPEKDGMNSGETILWQVWDYSENRVCTAVPSYSMGSGEYGLNSVNIISHLEVTCPPYAASSITTDQGARTTNIASCCSSSFTYNCSRYVADANPLPSLS